MRSPLDTPFLQAEAPQLPQPLLIGLVLHTLYQFHYPSLDTFQDLSGCPELSSPEVDIVRKVWPQQCLAQNHFLSPTSHTTADPSQDATDSLGHLGTAGSSSAGC